MAFNVTEQKSSDELQLSLSGGQSKTRTLHFLARTSGEQLDLRPAELLGRHADSGPTLPLLGDALPADTDLICQSISVSYVEGSQMAWEFSHVYSPRTGASSPFPSGDHNRHTIRVVSEQVKMFTDLDGKELGTPTFWNMIDANDDPLDDGDPRLRDPANWVDPDAEVGVIIRGTKLTVDVHLAGLHVFDPRWVRWQNMVNSDQIFGLNAGEVQFVGVEMEEQVDPDTGLPGAPDLLYSGTLHFVVGRLVLGLPDETTIVILLDQRLVMHNAKKFIGSPPNDDKWVSEPFAWQVRRVHDRKPLIGLIPLTPLGPS